jgi:hypothetical protein
MLDDLEQHRAGPSGRRRPCSQFRTASTPKPKLAANCDWDIPSLRRMALTSISAGTWTMKPSVSSPREGERLLGSGQDPGLTLGHDASLLCDRCPPAARGSIAAHFAPPWTSQPARPSSKGPTGHRIVLAGVERDHPIAAALALAAPGESNLARAAAALDHGASRGVDGDAIDDHGALGIGNAGSLCVGEKLRHLDNCMHDTVIGQWRRLVKTLWLAALSAGRPMRAADRHGALRSILSVRGSGRGVDGSEHGRSAEFSTGDSPSARWGLP